MFAIEEVMECLCCCESYECEWHRRLRWPGVNRRELAEEMWQIVETSHAIHIGVIDPPEGWELIRGRNCHYWAPADRSR